MHEELKIDAFQLRGKIKLIVTLSCSNNRTEDHTKTSSKTLDKTMSTPIIYYA